jgi:hypothetical protein
MYRIVLAVLHLALCSALDCSGTIPVSPVTLRDQIVADANFADEDARSFMQSELIFLSWQAAISQMAIQHNTLSADVLAQNTASWATNTTLQARFVANPCLVFLFLILSVRSDMNCLQHVFVCLICPCCFFCFVF